MIMKENARQERELAPKKTIYSSDKEKPHLTIQEIIR